jgi:cytoskeletal protein RodZ
MKTFGSRLRYERERRQIDLRSIAESTKIAVPLLQGLERDDVSRWPSGIFRKSFIRSYAEAIGMDPEPVVREFSDLFPDPLEVEIPAVDVRPKLEAVEPPSASASARPLTVKLTITWSGTPFAGIGRFTDWKIVRLLL